MNLGWKTIVVMILMALFSVGARGEDSEVSVRTEHKIFDPESQSTITLTSGDRIIAVNADGSARNLEVRFGDGRTSTLSLAEIIRQVDGLYAGSRGRIIVLGRANWSTPIVSIVDIDAMSIIDMFAAYEPSISPNGEWIAFRKFIPNHFVDEQPVEFKVYDVGKSKETSSLSNADSLSVYAGVTVRRIDDCYFNGSNIFWGSKSDRFISACGFPANGSTINLSRSAIGILSTTIDDDGQFRSTISNAKISICKPDDFDCYPTLINVDERANNHSSLTFSDLEDLESSAFVELYWRKPH